MSTTDFAKAIQRMLAITDTGLTYSKAPYDRERYEDLRQILWSVLQDQTELDQEELTAILKPTLCNSLDGCKGMDCSRSEDLPG